MSLRCTAVRADQALPTLADALAELKQGAPLRPVTVIVPTNAVGVTARRWLGAHGGIAAIEILTPTRLAERFVGAELASAGRRPVSTPLIDITIRQILSEQPGAYAAVAEHPSTVTSLRELYREVRLAGAAAITNLANASTRGRDAAAVLHATQQRLATEWYDEADLLRAAVEQISHEAPTGDFVVFLPRLDLGWHCDLLRALGEASNVHTLIESTGHEVIDQEAVEFADAIGGRYQATDAAPPVDSTTIISTTDADDEVRHAVRFVVDAARAGTPLARMAVVWPTDQPYARLVEHHLDQAGVGWNGRPGTLVTERLVPRFLLDVLQLDRRGLRRNDLFDFLADLPLRDPAGERISVGQWERVARSAGVSRGEHWEPRLQALAANLRARPDSPDHQRRADIAEQMATFVGDLRRDLGSHRRTRTWMEWAEWCEWQVLRRLGRSILDQLDEAERLASDHASKVLDRLRYLDVVGQPVTRAEFRAAFAAEFEGAPGRLGRLGNGVTIGSLAGTVGLDADLTIVLGAADGLMPPTPRIDPLISERDRQLAGLVSSDARVHRLHRGLIGHLTTSNNAIISVPRGDLRATTERLPSRWVALHAAEAPEITVNSHHAGLTNVSFPASTTEHRLRGRLVAAADGPDHLVAACAHDKVATRGLLMRAARRANHITAYDGDLTGVRIDHLQRPMSASQIEQWRSCPHAYFVRHLLGIRPLDDPADEIALSPIERGNVVHETLDRFHQLVVDGTLPQPDADGWTPTHTSRLDQLFDEVADEFEQTGRTGRAAHWHLDRTSVRHDLLNWFVKDGRTAALRHAKVVHSELRFGWDDPVSLPLPDGRQLAVAGFVDRIDEQPTGDLIVMDHKSGSDRNYSGITADDPTEGGTRFQLPIYAAAALAQHGELPASTTREVLAEYDFFNRGSYQRHGYRFDQHVWATVSADLGEVIAGIESGLYPAVTEPPKFQHRIDCHYCQPDGLGVDERYDEWSRKQGDERLTRWFADDDERSDGGGE